MKAADWDDRYSSTPLLWSAEPNRWVVEHTADLPVGRALDLAAGEGRNAIWLAEQGWDALAVDFSAVALERAGQVADARLGDGGGRLSTLVADVVSWQPPEQAFDLVLLSYLQLPHPPRGEVIARAAAAVAPDGHLLVVGHDARNLQEGYGGPRDPAVLYGPDDVLADLAGSGLTVVRAATDQRPVTDADGVEHAALDVVVLARRDR